MSTPSVARFAPPKASLFPHYIKRQKTTSYPETAPRASSTNIVRTLSWSPLGTHIATGMNSKSIRVWDPEKPRLAVHEFRGHSLGVEKVAFHPGGEPELVSVGEDGMVKFWDVRSKSAAGECKVGGWCLGVSWSPDGRELVVGKKVSDSKNDDLVRIDRATRTVIATSRQSDQTNQTCFSWGGDALLVTTTDGLFKILDYPSLDELARFPAHNSSCNCIAYHPAGEYVATGASDGLISLYRTEGWLPAKTFDVASGTVKSVSFSCDGAYIVGGSDEGTGFDIGNVESGEFVYKVETKEPVPIVQWSPKDYAIAYAPGAGMTGGLRVIGAHTPS